MSRFWGDETQVANIIVGLRERYGPDQLHILVPKSNEDNLTYDGIDVCAEHSMCEIEKEINLSLKRAVPFRKISIIGYSLGGLIARYVVGLLFLAGWLERLEPVVCRPFNAYRLCHGQKLIDSPQSFVTIATPHLGIYMPFSGSLYHRGWNYFGPRTLSTTGRQLFLSDIFRETGQPLLVVLSEVDSTFMRGLASYGRRSLYGNLMNDRVAPFFSTSFYDGNAATLDISNANVRYLPNSQEVLVDDGELVSNSPCPARDLRPSFRSFLGQLPSYSLLFFLSPILLGIFFINSRVQTYKSNARRRQHEQEKETIHSSNAGNQKEASSAEPLSLESAESSEYDNTRSRLCCDGSGSSSLLKMDRNQKAIRLSLNSLGFRKYPVHIHRDRHSHAAIIVRKNRESFMEGWIVIRHMVQDFVI